MAVCDLKTRQSVPTPATCSLQPTDPLATQLIFDFKGCDDVVLLLAHDTRGVAVPLADLLAQMLANTLCN